MGDIYQASQELKPRIESARTIMDALRDYSVNGAGECSLESLGSGLSNTHFRLGELESGLWLATRENFILEDCSMQRVVAEMYARHLEYAHKEGKRTSRVCLAVKVPSVDIDEIPDRYFLIVEDFTHGGTARFIPGQRGEEYGMLNGERVYYDFPDDIQPVEFRFTDDRSVLHMR
ncbi:MAG: hypothetical protein Q7R76_05620 [Candidatus Woesearchaeota archaeon]|nr:hypothetical protein [Candidatus Woesearchaeota archaeon]